MRILEVNVALVVNFVSEEKTSNAYFERKREKQVHKKKLTSSSTIMMHSVELVRAVIKYLERFIMR